VCALSNGDGVTSFKHYLDPKLANDCLQGLREVAHDSLVRQSGQMSDSGE